MKYMLGLGNMKQSQPLQIKGLSNSVSRFRKSSKDTNEIKKSPGPGSYNVEKGLTQILDHLLAEILDQLTNF